ncbi:MAG: hypothetical protein MJZ27_08270 [Bacteroidales bacterium]|nr:hypothetical protein [Bacteroidales bacterium]
MNVIEDIARERLGHLQSAATGKTSWKVDYIFLRGASFVRKGADELSPIGDCDYSGVIIEFKAAEDEKSNHCVVDRIHYSFTEGREVEYGLPFMNGVFKMGDNCQYRSGDKLFFFYHYQYKELNDIVPYLKWVNLCQTQFEVDEVKIEFEKGKEINTDVFEKMQEIARLKELVKVYRKVLGIVEVQMDAEKMAGSLKFGRN